MYIDYGLLVQAKSYFESLGYTEVNVPWLVSPEAIEPTLPRGRSILETKIGCLVASGEQSLIQMMIDGVALPSKAYCVTPCFRDEEVFDELHLPSFLKIELFASDSCRETLESMIQSVLSFNKRYVAVEILELTDGTYDIVDIKNKIELGSYVVRRYKNFRWIYGTGLALPRFTTVLTKQ
jgi:aspartyl/asparaginyl-tRNA synthetase